MATDIQTFVLKHPAVNHPYLDAISTGSLPNMQLALQDYAEQYSYYSKHFTAYIKLLMKHLSNSMADKLNHNLQEEMGHVDERELALHAIDPDWVVNVRHTDLFKRFATAIGAQNSSSLTYCQEVVAWHNTMMKLCSENAALAVGALGYGTEFIVKFVYEKIINGINYAFPNLPRRDRIFFDLHVLFDDDHADTLIEIANQICSTPQGKEQLLSGISQALTCREMFYDAMYKRALNMEPMHIPTNVSKLYDNQADKWVRKEPICLSDFTARPKIIEMCDASEGISILDVGCGDGYCSRILAEKGAKVVGVDISEKMILAAKNQESIEPLGIDYYVANATKLVDCLREFNAPLSYDVVVAVFLFNYVKRSDMNEIISQVNQLLKPGGKFVFSVPHPAFPFWKREKEKEAYPFKFDLEHTQGYFDLKDELFTGRIWRLDGKELHVQLVHKTLDDYFTTLKSYFDTENIQIKELYADANLQEIHPKFVENLKGIPLHVAFLATKKDSSNTILNVKHCLWPSLPRAEEYTVKPPFKMLDKFKTIPALNVNQVQFFSQDGNQLDIDGKGLYNTNGALYDSKGKLILDEHLVREFNTLGMQVSNLLKTIGVAFINDLEQLEEDQQRLFFFLVSAFSATGIFTKRDRVYDVYDRGLNVRDEDVLFSATNEASSFHTDSTDRFYCPDVVGLLCINQAAKPEQGALEIVNAANAYEKLRKTAPAFVLQELQKPIFRDLIDKGFGNSQRKPRERIFNNQFPVFDSPFKFRYMRFWVDTGFQKAEQEMTPETKQALDTLDKTLVEIPRLSIRLKRGEMVWCNNLFLAHNREAYQDIPGMPKRHMVRVWTKLN